MVEKPSRFVSIVVAGAMLLCGCESQLVVFAKPEGAEVLLDDKPIGTMPVEERLSANRVYQIEIKVPPEVVAQYGGNKVPASIAGNLVVPHTSEAPARLELGPKLLEVALAKDGIVKWSYAGENNQCILFFKGSRRGISSADSEAANQIPPDKTTAAVATEVTMWVLLAACAIGFVAIVVIIASAMP